MRQRAPREPLKQEQPRDHEEELSGRPLARSELPAGQGAVVEMGRRPLAAPAEEVELAEEEQDRPGPAQKRQQAQRAPEIGRAARPVPDQGFVGPVVRVRIVLPGALGHGRPGRPREIGGERPHLPGRLDVGRRQARGRRQPAEIRLPFLLLGIERGDLARGEHERAGRGIVTVHAQVPARQAGRDVRVLLRQLGEGAAEALPRVGVVADLRKAVQVFGAVIRPEVGAVSPERAVLHETVLEEHLLAAEDRLLIEHLCPACIRDSRRDRRRVGIGEDRDVRQDREACDQDQDRRVAPPGRQSVHDTSVIAGQTSAPRPNRISGKTFASWFSSATRRTDRAGGVRGKRSGFYLTFPHPVCRDLRPRSKRCMIQPRIAVRCGVRRS
jgi:hypothetical protein